MHDQQSIAEIRGLGVSAIFFSSFGTLWMVLSFHAWRILNVATGMAIAAVAALLLFSAVTLLRSAKRESTETDNLATLRALKWINVTLGVAIAGLCFALGHAHLDAYIPSALTALVGLHKFALARTYRFKPYYATGAVLLIWAVGSATFIPLDSLAGIASFGTGTIVWLYAAVVQLYAWRGLRKNSGIEQVCTQPSGCKLFRTRSMIPR
jgi:membrane protein implicated in regulation of membrane protease activity